MIKIKQTKSGKYYFLLYLKNGYVLVRSQYYASKAACYNGIEALKAFKVEQIIDETE